MPSHAFTIRKLADAAGVGVEAVRYYQRRGLLQEPDRQGGQFRAYSQHDVDRLKFVKRAQELGFTLEDVAELISLDGSVDQLRAREIAQRRIREIRERVADLESIAGALGNLVNCCQKSTPSMACPIIEALAGTPLIATSEAFSAHAVEARL